MKFISLITFALTGTRATVRAAGLQDFAEVRDVVEERNPLAAAKVRQRPVVLPPFAPLRSPP